MYLLAIFLAFSLGGGGGGGGWQNEEVQKTSIKIEDQNLMIPALDSRKQ